MLGLGLGSAQLTDGQSDTNYLEHYSFGNGLHADHLERQGLERVRVRGRGRGRGRWPRLWPAARQPCPAGRCLLAGIAFANGHGLPCEPGATGRVLHTCERVAGRDELPGGRRVLHRAQLELEAAPKLEGVPLARSPCRLGSRKL